MTVGEDSSFRFASFRMTKGALRFFIPLRFIQNDKGGAQNDKGGAQNDKGGALNDSG